MEYAEFIDRVGFLAGLVEREEVERAVAAALGALGERLGEDELHALGTQLPTPLVGMLRRGEHGGALDLADFYARVGRREGVGPGFAREHAQVVCRVLGEAMSDDARSIMEAHFPALHAELFAPRPRPGDPPPHVHRAQPSVGATLATGRPGSHHPLSEARPEPAHSHSVARSAHPHEDTKLSTSRGSTQERLGETLAEGRPGPSRPLSEEDR